jgi:ABC-type sugar transport system permease subunit
LVFISPGVAYFLIFWILPVILTAVQSLWRWDIGRPSRFIGTDNYTSLLTDPFFVSAVRASLGISLGVVVVGFFTAFILAWILSDETLRAGRLFRIIIFLPVVTDWVATGLVWQFIFLPNQGVLAGVLYNLGLRDWMGLRWVSTRDLAPIAIIVFILWKTTGLYTVILLAGLKSVPRTLMEAARADGANEWQVLINIVLPLLKPIIVFVIVVSFVTTIGLFEPVFMLTGGGPADATKTLPIFIHEQFFVYLKGGYASAAGILFLLLCLLFAVVASRQLRQNAYEE